MNFKFDIIQTIAIATIVLLVGGLIKRKVRFLEKYCIPNPVIGGIIFSLIALYGRNTGQFVFEFDTTLQNIFMTVFFTAVGFSCELKAFGRSGKKGLQLCIVIVMIVILQDSIGILLSKLFNLNPLIGLCVGSVSMIGGHGTSGAFAPIFETLGATGATTVALSAATFGLVSGGMIGGPIARRLIEKHNLLESANKVEVALSEAEVEPITSGKMYTSAYQIIIAMGIGTLVSKVLVSMGLTFPAYMGGMLMGLFIRNLSEYSKKFDVSMGEINILGEISLSLFVSMALMTLRLWELAQLAVPMIVMLSVQVVTMFFFASFIAFRILGRDYDASVMVCGICGFGMGAMPNALTNMQALTNKYLPSPTAFFVIPAIGSLCIDISNSLLITFFMNILT